jgi:hypothetical protein
MEVTHDSIGSESYTYSITLEVGSIAEENFIHAMQLFYWQNKPVDADDIRRLWDNKKPAGGGLLDTVT